MTILQSLDICHPIFAARARALHDDLIRAYNTGVSQVLFDVFESVRLPDRQNQLFAKGRSKARAWQSPHQYGLAADFVPMRVRLDDGSERNGWTWDVDVRHWDFLRERAKAHGLYNGIVWDRAHVESAMWDAWKLWMKG